MKQSQTKKQKTQKSNQKSLLKVEASLLEYLSENKLSKTKIIVASSTGIDSMALIEALIRIEYPRELIHCAHLDHGLRKESALALNFLEQYCKEKEIGFYSKSYPYGELNNDENTARKKRYDFFIEACQQLGSKHLFTAHNSNDDAETIIFRLIRGTASQGLVGIPKNRELTKDTIIHRPLINISREDIEDYQKSTAFHFIEDESNTNTEYSRNKIRHQILPHCKSINPKALENIRTLAELISEEQDFIKHESTKASSKLGAMPWDIEDLRLIPRAILRRILTENFTSNIKFCNEFINAIHQGGFHKINYSKGLFFVIKQKQIHKETTLPDVI